MSPAELADSCIDSLSGRCGSAHVLAREGNLNSEVTSIRSRWHPGSCASLLRRFPLLQRRESGRKARSPELDTFVGPVQPETRSRKTIKVGGSASLIAITANGAPAYVVVGNSLVPINTTTVRAVPWASWPHARSAADA